MIQDLDFPATGIERMELIAKVSKQAVDWTIMTDEQKLWYVVGMSRGHTQGLREMARRAINNLHDGYRRLSALRRKSARSQTEGGHFCGTGIALFSGQ